MNMKSQSEDHFNNELHMTSWMHQLMSQGNQMAETTPGQSQKLLRLPRLLE